MSAQVIELFGQDPSSELLPDLIRAQNCPFVGGRCTKSVGGRVSGACVLQMGDGRGPIVCCPKRLYAANYQLLHDLIPTAFGSGVDFVRSGQQLSGGRAVIPFGQREGRELRIPRAEGVARANLSIDWILAEVSSSRNLVSFIAVEIQTIDTTGTYQSAIWDAFHNADPAFTDGWTRPPRNTAQWNLENVRKRILPQLIRKGHILRRETKCQKGLFFVCPTPILREITGVLGAFERYAPGSGTITFIGVDYNLDALGIGTLSLGASITTTVEQVYLALASPRDLPPSGVYEAAIVEALGERISHDGRVV